MWEMSSEKKSLKMSPYITSIVRFTSQLHTPTRTMNQCNLHDDFYLVL